MSNTKDIPTFHQTIDFDSLMREARKHITALAGELWTDHNPSDPGITQLEVLAFCIADLSYRTSFDVKNLIAGYKGGLSEVYDLPLMDVALPNHPVTVKDLRKLLIDMVHPRYAQTANLPLDDRYETKLLVRNAFPVIAEEAEVAFYAAAKAGKDTFLTFNTSYEEVSSKSELAVLPIDAQEGAVLPNAGGGVKAQKSIASQKKPLLSATAVSLNAAASVVNEIENVFLPFGEKVKRNFEFLDLIELNGLYKIQIEFEEDVHYRNVEQKHLRDLNQNFFQSPVQSDSKTYEISVLMPYWDDIKWSLKDLDLNDPQTQLQLNTRYQYDYFIAVDKLNYDDYFYDYYAEVLLGGHHLPLYIKVHFLDQYNEIKQGIPDSITVSGKTLSFRANFLDWNELANGVNQNYHSGGNHQLSPNLQSFPADWLTETHAVGIEGELPTFDIQTGFTFLKETITESSSGVYTYSYDRQKHIKLLTRITFDEGVLIKDTDITQVEAALSAKFPVLFAQKVNLEKAIKEKIEDIQAIFYTKYLEKLRRVFENLYGENGIWSYLGKYRNLGEDFAQFSASRVQEVALFGKLKLAPGYNINELLAEIYFRVDQFLSPLVKFNSLSEMTAKGYRFEELFNGPTLRHGFIDEADLDNLKRRAVVYTSDLIRIIMDVPGVLFVEDFSISSYIDNRLMGRNVLNCLSLTNSEIYKPQFGYDKTKLEIWVDDERVTYDKISVKSWYNQKRENQKAEQLPTAAELLADQDLMAIPGGRDMEVDHYHSIQHDFPEVYGIGPYGLPLDADDERKASAKQLKAFLLPFEQLLANYLKQIAHLPELFSFSRSVDRTYQYQPLYAVPDIQPLFTEIAENSAAWDSFKQDLDNVYMTQVKAGESSSVFLDRRNRFLSHLLARFGESFEGYARQMFDRHKALLNDPINGITNFRLAQAATLEKLIQDKMSFAEDYAAVSGERYKSFDTTVPNLNQNTGGWNNMNIGSYKLRLCRLLGIEHVANESIFMAVQTPQGNWVDKEGMHIVEHILLRPRTSNAELLALKNEALPNAQGSFIYDAEKDPYSFRITVVLPKYAGRFVDKSFRQFTERLIRMETPAHIRVDFRWMSGQCGKNFETHYSRWKDNVYKLTPALFQKVARQTELDQKALQTNHGANEAIAPKMLDRSAVQKRVAKGGLQKVGSAVDRENLKADLLQMRESILTLQDKLVTALQTPCTLKLTAYNQIDQVFTATNGVIRFVHLSTDIFNLRVSEIGGVITVYKLDRNANDWKSVGTFNPVVKTYFNVNDFLLSDLGLTANYGNCGWYKVEYEMADRDPVELLIEVQRAKTKPIISIGDAKERVILDFNTETDGVFRRSNQTWDPFFLQFYPAFPQNSCGADKVELVDESAGIVTISSPQKGLEPTVISMDKPQNGMFELSLKDIYTKFGLGNYHIVYSLDGLDTSADVDLFVELAISVFNKKTQLVRNDDGIIVVPSAVRVVDLFLDLPGGGLTVYDLDGRARIAHTFSENLTLHGTIAYYKKADHVQINRDKEDLYQDGHHYRFVYDFFGESVEEILLFESPKLEIPSVKLFANKAEMTVEPFVLLIQNERNDYAIEFHPKDAQVEGWIMQEDGSRKVIEALTVSQDHLLEPLEVGEMYRNHGSVPIYVSCANAAGFYQLNFTLKLADDLVLPTKLAIKDTLTGKEVSPQDDVFKLVYNYLNPKQQFELFFNNGGGNLNLTDDQENDYSVGVNKNTIRFDGTNTLVKGLPTGEYKCTYQPKSGTVLDFRLKVINLRPIFELTKIGGKGPLFQATAIPLYPEAQTYIWRLNGKYVSRAKNPQLSFDFQKTDRITVELTMHLEDIEMAYQMEITAEEMKKG